MREAPRDIEAEQVVLAAVLLDAKAIYTVCDLLTETDFFAEHHRLIYRAMLGLKQQLIAIDYFTVKSELQRLDKLNEVGGIPAITKLTEGIPVISNVAHYCTIVRQKAICRALMTLSDEMHNAAASQEQGPQELIEVFQARMLGLYGRYQGTGLKPIADVVHEGNQELEQRYQHKSGLGISTGFVSIDYLLGGMRSGNMIVLAARPGCGKTSLAVSIAVNVAKTGKRVAIFSLEMGNTELYCRMIATEAQLRVGGLLGGKFQHEDWRKITHANSVLSSQPILMDESGSISMMQIGARARRAKMENGLDLIVIDYLQLIQGPGKSGYEKVTGISRDIKILAKELKIPIIVLSQLHRLESEETEPQLSDLRESGAIEQDADVVLFIWAHETADLRNCKIGKQRNGPLGYFVMGFDSEQTRFYDAARG